MTAEWKRYFILSVTMLLLLKVLSCNLGNYSTGINEKCPPVAQNEILTRAEIDNFLELWPSYLQQGFQQELSEKISLMTGNVSEHIPWKVNFWLNKHCWTAERFYYVEQRLRNIIHTLRLKQHTDAVKAVLSERLKTESDKAKSASYQEMIEQQDKIYNIENISNEELQLLSGREEKTEQILNGETRN